MDASIIIPAFGRTDLLRRTLTAALAQDYPADAYEVIVVDSSPDDANERLVRGLAPSAPCRLRVLRKDPEGPGPSRNAGARASSGVVRIIMDLQTNIEGRDVLEPGVVHQDVDCPRQGAQRPRDAVRVRHVHGHALCRAPRRHDLPAHGARRLPIAVRDHDVLPLERQLPGHAGADPARSARDEDRRHRFAA